MDTSFRFNKSSFPNESRFGFSNDSHFVASHDSFLRMEKLCESPRKPPRILLNDSPLNMTINNSILYSSEPDLNTSVSMNSSVFESEGDSYYRSSEYELESEGNMVSRMIHLYARKHARPRVLLPDLSMVMPASQMSRYQSEPNLSSDFSAKVIDSFSESRTEMRDICSDLRIISQSPPELNHSMSFADRLYCDLKSSAYFPNSLGLHSTSNNVLANGTVTSQHDDDSLYTSAYFSNQSSFKVRDSLDSCSYRSPIRLPDRQTTRTPANSTSSRQLDSLLEESNDEMYVEPDDLNDTLERVNYRLAVCGAVTPSPTRMKNTKSAMQEYLAELRAQESMQSTTVPKRTRLSLEEDDTFMADKSLFNLKTSSPIKGADGAPVDCSKTNSFHLCLEASSSSTDAGVSPCESARADIVTRSKNTMEIGRSKSVPPKNYKRTISVDHFISLRNRKLNK